MFRYLNNRIHLWTGLALALPLVLLGLSGAVLTARWNLDYRLNKNLYQVRESKERLGWDDLLEKARGETSESITLLRNNPTGHGAVIAHTSTDQMIHLDPSTGTVIGVRDFTDWRSVIWWIQEFHTSFFLGEWGHTLVSTTTIISLISLLTGFVLWLIPLSKEWVARFGIRWSNGGTRFNWDFHNALGFYTLPVVALIFVTGITIGFWGTLGPMIYGLTGTEAMSFASPNVEPTDTSYSLQRAARQAQKHWPDSTLKRIVISGDTTASVRMRFETPNAAYEPGLSWIWVNPYTGEVLKERRPRDRSMGDSIYLWLFPLHFGGWGHVWGETTQWITRFLWIIGSLSPAILSVTGLLIWWWK
ncbi:MAG: PepSY-associated TM helix domain-containing protein [bacterium]